MGCKSDPRKGEMQNRGTDDHRGQASANNTTSTTHTHEPTSTQDIPIYPHTSQHPPTSPASASSEAVVPTSPTAGLAHSSTAPNLHGNRPHSAHHHRQIGCILRIMGDSYCYSCGIALRQMGDEISGEYEVRRALSMGDLPNSLKTTR